MNSGTKQKTSRSLAFEDKDDQSSDHDLIQDGISNCRSRLMGDIDMRCSCHVVLDISNGHPTGIQADDYIINVGQSPRFFRDHGRQE